MPDRASTASNAIATAAVAAASSHAVQGVRRDVSVAPWNCRSACSIDAAVANRAAGSAARARSTIRANLAGTCAAARHERRRPSRCAATSPSTESACTGKAPVTR